MKKFKKIAVISQNENGMYEGEIKNIYGDTEATITAKMAFEVHTWAFDHKCVDVELDY